MYFVSTLFGGRGELQTPLWQLFLLDIKQMFKLGAFSRVNEGVPIPFGQECSSNEFTNKGLDVSSSDWKILTAPCSHPYAYVCEELSGPPLLTHSPAKRSLDLFMPLKLHSGAQV